MKKTSKIKTIIKAFTQDSDIDATRLEERRAICGKCPHNSDNNENLSAMDRIRKKVITSPFCTICGCQIKEKTATDTEFCPDTPRRWNGLYLETDSDNDPDFVNGNPEFVNIDLIDNVVVFDLGEVSGQEISFSFGVIDKNDEPIKFEAVLPACQACTVGSFEQYEEHYAEVHITLLLNRIQKGEGKKNVTLVYYKNQERKVINVRITYNNNK